MSSENFWGHYISRCLQEKVATKKPVKSLKHKNLPLFLTNNELIRWNYEFCFHQYLLWSFQILKTEKKVFVFFLNREVFVKKLTRFVGWLNELVKTFMQKDMWE